jgi:hypothetical protein
MYAFCNLRYYIYGLSLSRLWCKADLILEGMDVASVVCHGCAGRADAILLLLLLLATVVITPAKWIKLVDDVLVEDCNRNPCGDGLE